MRKVACEACQSSGRGGLQKPFGRFDRSEKQVFGKGRKPIFCGIFVFLSVSGLVLLLGEEFGIAEAAILLRLALIVGGILGLLMFCWLEFWLEGKSCRVCEGRGYLILPDEPADEQDTGK